MDLPTKETNHCIEIYSSLGDIELPSQLNHNIFIAKLHATALLICADLEENPEYLQQAQKLIDSTLDDISKLSEDKSVYRLDSVRNHLNLLKTKAFAVRYAFSPESDLTKTDAINALKSYATLAEMEINDFNQDRLLGPIYEMMLCGGERQNSLTVVSK